MPELPEVETTRRGIAPFLEGAQIDKIVVRDRRLRWPIPEAVSEISDVPVLSLARRAKYLLLEIPSQILIMHLGMSGSMRVIDAGVAPEKHDHVDIITNSGKTIRYNDPRRFGAMLLVNSDEVYSHPLIASLGPEPHSEAFNADYFHQTCRNRKRTIKAHLMDGSIVVGVGNIYASEALFMAGIRPTLPADKLSKPRAQKLVDAAKLVLQQAIDAGGTTLSDFTQADGKPGYFRQSLQVYAKLGQPCPTCGNPIKSRVIAQRNTFYCSACQAR